VTQSLYIVPFQENAGNPERIRLSLAAAGQRRYLEGVERRQLDMLGPVNTLYTYLGLKEGHREK
jgi:hypothetical protein